MKNVTGGRSSCHVFRAVSAPLPPRVYGYNEGMNIVPALPHIPLDANKYTRGSLLVLAGSRRYFGAGVLATLAAEKTGAGYVSLATPTSAALAARQHLLCSPVIEGDEDGTRGSFSAAALPAILQEIRRISAICAGPGLTVCEQTVAFLGELLLYASVENIPLLLDADALGILAAEPGLLSGRRAQKTVSPLSEGPSMNPLVLTPHEGELARLFSALILESPQKVGEFMAAPKLEVSVAEAAMLLAGELDAVLVAKGPTTYVAGGGELFESNKASPALAKAGTGDVLAGVISSLLAQGMAAMDAALLGVQLHSLAGIQAEHKLGRRSVTALDVIEALPQAVARFES